MAIASTQLDEKNMGKAWYDCWHGDVFAVWVVAATKEKVALLIDGRLELQEQSRVFTSEVEACHARLERLVNGQSDYNGSIAAAAKKLAEARDREPVAA